MTKAMQREKERKVLLYFSNYVKTNYVDICVYWCKDYQIFFSFVCLDLFSNEFIII